MNKKKSQIIVTNTKWIYLSKLFGQIFALLSTIIIIRQLEVDIFGTYNLLLSSFVVIQIVSLSAVSNVFNRYIPEIITNQEHHKLKKFIRYGIGISTIILSLIVVCIFNFSENIGMFLNIENLDGYMYAFVIFSYSHFLHILVDVILKALLLHKQASILTIFIAFLRFTLYVIFINQLNVNLLLYIESLNGFIFFISSLVIYKHYTKNIKYDKNKSEITPVTFKRVKRYGLYSMFNEFGVGLVGKTSDYFIVAAISNPYQVGLFAFAHRIYGIIFKILPYKDFTTIIRPLFFQKFTNEYSLEEFRNMYSFMIKVLVPIYVLPAIYFLIFGKSIINLVFDDRYLDAYWITVIILSSNLFLAFFYPLGLTAQLKERMDIVLYSKSVAVLSIFASIFGMKYYGLMGVVLATLLGDLLKNLFILYMMREYAEIKYRLNDYTNFITIGLLTLPFLVLQPLTLNTISLISLSFIFFLYISIIIILFHPFNTYDLNLLDNISSKSKALKKIKFYVLNIHDEVFKRLNSN